MLVPLLEISAFLQFNLICYLCHCTEGAGISGSEGLALNGLPFYHYL